eukprot:scaffold294619_cov28-Prasinocladus_malaysianus.AAC.3
MVVIHCADLINAYLLASRRCRLLLLAWQAGRTFQSKWASEQDDRARKFLYKYCHTFALSFD